MIDVMCRGTLWQFIPNRDSSGSIVDLKLQCKFFSRVIQVSSECARRGDRRELTRVLQDTFSSEELKSLHVLRREDIVLDGWRIEKLTLPEYFRYRRNLKCILCYE